MTEAERLNGILAREAPAVWRALSDVGRRAAFPLGNPAQSAEAKGTALDATIGQITDGKGGPLPLPAVAARVMGDAAKWLLYSPQQGHPDLRKAWGARQRRWSGGSTAATSQPLVVHGLTQGIGMVAELFADPETTVLLPDLAWENYELMFTLRQGARIRTYPHYAPDGTYDVDGLARALDETPGKAILVLGFPGNPTGFTPTVAQGRRIVEVVTAARGPLVIVFDDAYAGLLFEDGLLTRSLYWDVLERHDPERHVVIKVDGATKELFFFPGRVGFVTHSATGAAEAALESKLKCMGRATVGSPPGPSQALVYDALQDPDLERQIAAGVADMATRYRALKKALSELDTDKLKPYPFNSGLFALVQVHPSIDADHLRRRLIAEQSVGVIALPEQNAIRIAFCSVAAADLPELVRRIGACAA
jgi:aspartate/methionine/tyrosine aminotransferase